MSHDDGGGPMALDTAVIYTGTVYTRVVYTPANYTTADCTEVGQTAVDTRPWTMGHDVHEARHRVKGRKREGTACHRPCLINLA